MSGCQHEDCERPAIAEWNGCVFCDEHVRERLRTTADNKLSSENAKLRRALEPLRHMRVRHDGNYAEADCEILNMVNGVQCVVAYARSGTEANEFDEIFERVREALK